MTIFTGEGGVAASHGLVISPDWNKCLATK